MRRIEIENNETLEKLHRLKKQGKKQQERVRAHAILLSNDGKEIVEIADIFNVTPRTVYYWFKTWIKEGINGLSRKKGDGRKPLLNPIEHKSIISKHINENPHQPKKAYSLTIDELGISISYKTFQRFLKKYLT